MPQHQPTRLSYPPTQTSTNPTNRAHLPLGGAEAVDKVQLVVEVADRPELKSSSIQMDHQQASLPYGRPPAVGPICAPRPFCSGSTATPKRRCSTWGSQPPSVSTTTYVAGAGAGSAPGPIPPRHTASLLQQPNSWLKSGPPTRLPKSDWQRPPCRPTPKQSLHHLFVRTRHPYPTCLENNQKERGLPHRQQPRLSQLIHHLHVLNHKNQILPALNV